MITIYWSPWYRDINIYKENYLCYHEIDKVFPDLVKEKNQENIADNFFNCHAFKSVTNNLYCLRNPYSVDVEYTGRRFISKHPRPTGHDLSMVFANKQPSVKDCLTINYCVNWIFFADKPLKIQTLHPWMHKTDLSKTAYYVPGSFDISKWFRPIEGAYQLFPGENSFKAKEGDPLIYLNVLTEEKVQFKKFFLTQEIIDLSMSCMNLKHFKSFKALSSLYNTFVKSSLRKKVLKEIQKNIIED